MSPQPTPSTQRFFDRYETRVSVGRFIMKVAGFTGIITGGIAFCTALPVIAMYETNPTPAWAVTVLTIMLLLSTVLIVAAGLAWCIAFGAEVKLENHPDYQPELSPDAQVAVSLALAAVAMHRADLDDTPQEAP